MNRPHRSSVAARSRLLVALIALLTLGAALGIALSAARAVNSTMDAAEDAVAFESLHGQILYHDQVLTQTARLAVLREDLSLQDTYGIHVALLDDALVHATALAKSVNVLDPLAQASSANQALITYENAAFALTKRGHVERATELLFGVDYTEQKSALQAGMEAFFSEVGGALDAKLSAARSRTTATFFAALFSLFGVACLWALVLRSIGRQAVQLERARDDLEAAHAALARQARRRELSFFDDGPIAMLEVDITQLLSLSANERPAPDAVGTPSFRVRDFVSIRRMNAAALELLGAERADQIEAQRAAIWREEFQSGLSGVLTRAWEGELAHEWETRVWSLGGAPIDVIAHTRAASGPDDDEHILILSLVDVSELKAAEIAADTARIAAESANRAKSEFLAAMSHEIRTPMNGVLGMAAALQRRDLPEGQRQMVEVIVESGQALMVILNDLLDLSKIEAGRMELEHTDFTTLDIARSAEALFGSRASVKGLGFSVKVSDDAQGCYMGDEGRIKQILFNVLSNAIKFTHAGSVDVSIDVADDADVEPGAAQLRFTVTDTGVGVPEDKRATIFAPFTQADAGITRQYGGTGLGLSICQKLCRLMGGDIWVEPRPGGGSIFTFTITVDAWGDASLDGTRRDGSQADAGDLAAMRDDRTPRILAAEDVANNQLVLRAILSAVDVELTIVENGSEAVAAWSAGDFDLILMDVQMPVMDGPTAVREIRRLEQAWGRARTPILALSANAMRHQVAEYLAAGMDGHVAKPIDPANLLETLMSALAMAQPANPSDSELDADVA